MRSVASLDSWFARLGAAIARRPRAILAGCALLLALAGGYGATVARHLPGAGLQVSGSESDLVGDAMASRFGVGQADVVLLYRSREGSVRDALVGSLVIDSLDPVLADPGVTSATTVFDTGNAKLVSRDGHETLATLSLRGDSTEKLHTYRRIEPLLRAVDPSLEISIGGATPLELLLQDIAERDVIKAEKIALPIAALLMLLLFRGPIAALLPAMIGALALAASAALLRLTSQFTEVSIFALNVGAFLGLGLSIDYALLLVQRFREELAGGAPPAAAVAATLDTAGRAVWISGLAVGVSLAALFWVPLPVLRSVSLGGVLVVASALFGALVPLPALLAWLGPGVNRWSIGRARDESAPSAFWHRVGRLSMRHPIAAALACLLVLGFLAAPALRLHGIAPNARALGPGSEAGRVDAAIADPGRFDPGVVSAIPIVVEMPGPVLEPTQLRVVRAYLEQLAAVPGVAGLVTPLQELDPDALSPDALALRMRDEAVSAQLTRMVDGDAALVIVENPEEWTAPESEALVERLRAVPQAGLHAGVGGPIAQMVELRETLASEGPIAALLIAAANLAILFIAFRSVAVPIKAVLMNVLALAASYGVLVSVFQDGRGAAWHGIQPLGGVDPTIPVVMFAVVFGLSMDYEVFLLSRIREEWLRTHDNRASVINGLARTGRIITSAALILLVVIGAFALGDFVYVRQMGVGMAAAIALDVTLVRALLVPATMQLLGEWNWWAPRWLAPREARRARDRGKARGLEAHRARATEDAAP